QWVVCPKCGATVFHRDLDANWRICPHCDHHLTLSAVRRFALLLDEDSWARIEVPGTPFDPLKFRDARRYADRLKEAVAQTHEAEAVAVAHGRIAGMGAVVAAFETRFLGGTLGAAAGEAIVAASELAVLQDAPLIIVTGCQGLRIPDGAFALMQLPRVALALRKVAERTLPLIVVWADPAFDPVSESLLQQADVVLAEPGARIGEAPSDPFAELDTPEFLAPRARVLDAQAARDRGRVDRIVDRRDLKTEIVAILDILRSPFPSATILTYRSKDVPLIDASDVSPNA
ncbi:MAG: acetyl-CoA carboxylase carboxyl transferase subunit beta, partial [Rhodospirillaceae bacterium]|nr:acetyl-CoA carboxylase carboxyl transferase subunit beta [Rhodospirillaceae bacterium]